MSNDALMAALPEPPKASRTKPATMSPIAVRTSEGMSAPKFRATSREMVSKTTELLTSWSTWVAIVPLNTQLPTALTTIGAACTMTGTHGTR